MSLLAELAATSGNARNGDGAAAAERRSKRGSLAVWIRVHGAVPATVAMVSRARWINVVSRWAACSCGQEALGQFHVRVDRFVRISEAMARHAHGGTGRNIAVTNRRIAEESGFSESSVTIVRRILLSSGWLHQSAAGCSSRTGRSNRPNIVHLTTRRPVDNQRQGAGSSSCVCDPLRSSQVSNKSLVTNKPKARRRALRDSSPKKDPAARRRWTAAYQIADELIGRTVGLGDARGQVATALMLSHLRLEAWSGSELKAALDVCALRSRRNWPAEEMRRPGGFVAWRLRELPVAPEHSAAPAPYVSPGPAPVTGEGRARALASVRELFAGRRGRKASMRGGEARCEGRGFNYVDLS